MSTTTDFGTLGRLSTSGSSGVRRRRPSRPRRRPGRGWPGPTALRAAAAVAVTAALGLWGLGAVVGSQVDVLSTVANVQPVVDPLLQAALRSGAATVEQPGALTLVPGGGAAGPTPASPATPFAALEDVALLLPLLGAEPPVFTEAGSAAALPLAPVGTMVRNGNPQGYAEALAALDGPDYLVAPPVSGVRPATGLAVLLAAPGTPVAPPVDGVVEQVRRTEDGGVAEVVIVPAGRADLHVVVGGLDAVAVVPGDAVAAGAGTLGAVGGTAPVGEDLNPLQLPAATVRVEPAVGRAVGTESAVAS